jgi:hypothetical protein
MNQLRFAFLLFCLAAFTVGAAIGSAAADLFNGRDLKGWVVMHGGEWTVEDGVLIGRNGTNWSTNPEKSGSWLRTEKEYGDFELRLEYKMPLKGNSGVAIRTPNKGESAEEKKELKAETEQLIFAGAGPVLTAVGSLTAATAFSLPAGLAVTGVFRAGISTTTAAEGLEEEGAGLDVPKTWSGVCVAPSAAAG